MFESITSNADQDNVRGNGKSDYFFWFENVARFRVSAVQNEGSEAPIMRLFVTDRNV